jgi:hypothetical protein
MPHKITDISIEVPMRYKARYGRLHLSTYFGIDVVATDPQNETQLR